MKQLLLRLIMVVALVLGIPAATIAADYPPLFQTEQQAQQHCPKDLVVWLNLPSGVYHFKGQRWYGQTKTGAFVCRQEADRVGDRPTRNGQ